MSDPSTNIFCGFIFSYSQSVWSGVPQSDQFTGAWSEAFDTRNAGPPAACRTNRNYTL